MCISIPEDKPLSIALHLKKKKNLPLKRLDKYKYKRYSRFASWVDSNNEITANAGRMACKSSAFYLKYNLIKNVNVQFMWFKNPILNYA